MGCEVVNTKITKLGQGELLESCVVTSLSHAPEIYFKLLQF